METPERPGISGAEPLLGRVARGAGWRVIEGELSPCGRLPARVGPAGPLGANALPAGAEVGLLAEDAPGPRRARRGASAREDAGEAPEPRPGPGSSSGLVRPIQIVFCSIGASDMYWLEVLRALESECREHEFVVRFSEAEADQFEGRTAAGFAEGAVGVVLCGYSPPAAVTLLRGSGVPFALIGDMADTSVEDEGVDIIVNDEVDRARRSTKHLLELGHRNIACVVGPPRSRLAAELTKGYREAMAGERLPRARHIVVEIERHTIGEGRRVGDAILQGARPPSAVFACDDRVAVGVMQAADDWNVAVPRGLSVVGRGDLEIAEAVSPRLTTSPDDPARNAHAAFEKLLAQLGGGKHVPCRTVVATPGLVVRESTARAPDA